MSVGSVSRGQNIPARALRSTSEVVSYSGVRLKSTQDSKSGSWPDAIPSSSSTEYPVTDEILRRLSVLGEYSSFVQAFTTCQLTPTISARCDLRNPARTMASFILSPRELPERGRLAAGSFGGLGATCVTYGAFAAVGNLEIAVRSARRSLSPACALYTDNLVFTI